MVLPVVGSWGAALATTRIILATAPIESSPRLPLRFARAGDLFDRIIARGSYTEADASRVVRELCGALAHVHRKGIVHRDLKPENILCASPADDAPIKITDFGLAAQHKVVESYADEAARVSEPASPTRGSFRLRPSDSFTSPVKLRRGVDSSPSASAKGSPPIKGVAGTPSLRPSRLTNASTADVGPRCLVGTPFCMLRFRRDRTRPVISKLAGGIDCWCSRHLQ